MKIEYSASVPPSLRKLVRERLRSVEGLFPGWVNKLTVGYSPDPEGDGIASCVPRHEYRSFGLTIHPLFFEEEDWREALLHEIGHGLLKPYTAVVDRIVEKFIADPHVRDFVAGQLRDAEEAVSEDLAIWASKLSSEE